MHWPSFMGGIAATLAILSVTVLFAPAGPREDQE